MADKSRRCMATSKAAVSCAAPFLVHFFTPVDTKSALGWRPLRHLVVITMDSLEPVFLVSRPTVVALATPLNFQECTPVKLPGSALITGMLSLLRMNEEDRFTHSQ